MRIRLVIPILAATTFLSACHRKPEPKPIEVGQVLPNIPLPAHGQALAREGGKDAMQFVVVTPDSPDSVVAYYRRTLSTGSFRLMNEQTVGHTTSFYAEQDGPSIWITVSPNGTEGTQVTIAGAADSTQLKPKTP